MVDREEPQLISNRTITGRGIVEIPTDSEYRYFWLYINVIRFPRTNFTNSKFNPDKSEYAKITWLRNDYVIKDDALNYEKQVFVYNVDPTGYIASGLACIYASLRDYLTYLAPFIPAPPLPTDPTDKIYLEPIKDIPDVVKIVCRESTGIAVKLYGLKYDVSCPEGTPTPKEPPDPPPESTVPPGTPIENSSPYSFPNDDGDTEPYEGDSLPPLDPCEGVEWWQITWLRDTDNAPFNTFIRGKEDDVFTFGLSPNGGCRNGQQQDLLMNGQVAYGGFGCGSRAINSTFTFMAGFSPGSGDPITENDLYPDC